MSVSISRHLTLPAFSRTAGPVLGALLLASCAQFSTQPAAPTEHRPVQAPATSPTTTAPTAPVPVPPPPGTFEKTRARWVPSEFSELPGWGADRPSEVMPALRQSCIRPAEGWARFCEDLRNLKPADDMVQRFWLESRLRVFRIESPEGDTAGLLTGYYEPLFEATRKPAANRRVPLHALPADLASRKPYWTRQQLDNLPAAQASVKGRELAWLEDPLDALVLQIQGSGRLRITEPDGSSRLIRLAFAGHNDQPYKSVGRWLIEQGELKASEASWPGIKDWARRNPARINEMLWQNPRTVFFREEPLPDPSIGPKGAQGVPLTPGRSIAVDPQSVPYGSLVWVDSTEPLSTRPLQRLVVAQDTGSAITGAVRADFFWGWGDEAESQAGRTRQALRSWVLWPRESAPR